MRRGVLSSRVAGLIDPLSQTPKVRQIVEHVCEAVRSGELRKGDALPSINAVSKYHGIACDTVVRAYNRLKETGLVVSAQGKGYCIVTDQVSEKARIFVLFDNFTPYMERLYDSLRAVAGERAMFDVFFHHYNSELFARLLADARGHYAGYVVKPFPDDQVCQALAQLEQEKLLMLDIRVEYPGRRCATIWQSHDEELVRALESAVERIRRYESLTLVFPEDKQHPQSILPAFRRFCRRHEIAHRVVSRPCPEEIGKGQAWFVIEDSDLVELVKRAREMRLKIGRDLGILSYNETPMKEVVEQGISVISIDFRELGRRAGQYLLAPSPLTDVLEPTRFISRDSL